MNSLMQAREATKLEQTDAPATGSWSQGAAVLTEPPSHTPAAGKPQPRRYLALLLLLGGLGVLALLGAVVLAVRMFAAPGYFGATAGGGIVVEDAWARAATRPSEGSGGTSAVYLLLRNQGDEQDQLIGATSDAAAATEVHRTLIEDGVMRMRPAGPVEVPAGRTMTLQPGGLHVMLIELQRELGGRERLSVTLQFERAGELPVDAEIRAPMHGR